MVIIRTKEGDLKIARGKRIGINSAGDVSVSGFLTDEDEKTERWATLCISKGDHTKYVVLEGQVEVVPTTRREPKRAG